MYYLYPDLARSLFQELEGDRHEDLMINVHTLINLPHFSPGWCPIMHWWLELDEFYPHGHGIKPSIRARERYALKSDSSQTG